MTGNTNIHIAAVLGSVRPNNYTSKALNLVVNELNSHKNISTTIIDPGIMELPLPGLQDNNENVRSLKEKITNATGVIFATPEYHGSFSSVIKLVIENLGFPSVLSGKPVALLGVAAGQIGAIKSLEQLRSVCSHIGAIVLPGPVSVANVKQVFDEKGTCLDETIEKRIRGIANSLINYINNNICPRYTLEEMVRQRTLNATK